MLGKWAGGVRVAVLDDKNRLLMVSQLHEGREIWMLPGGAIEAMEGSMEAAKREVLEETGLNVEIQELIWHIEEVSETRGQRFVNYFLAKVISGELVLGKDPELNEEEQVLEKVRFMNKEDMKTLLNVHPPFLKDEIWDIIERYSENNEVNTRVFRKRDYARVNR